MLGNAWIFLTLVILIVAVILKQSPLLIVAFLFFLTSGIARLWAKYALHKVEYKRHLSSNRVFFGESITFDVTITNNKFLPLPWVRIQEETPNQVSFQKGKLSVSWKVNREVLSGFLSLTWYHRVTRRYQVKCLKRGIFAFGPVTIGSGDPFGFFRNKVELPETESLLVYPRILELEELGIPSRHPFGDLRVKRHLFEDPVLAMTTRDYVPGDPLKNIHWKATARTQRLQSRVFEHTTTMDMALFLDARTAADTGYWSMISPDFLETGVLAATAIASYALKNEYKIGFYANEYYEYSDRLMRLPPSNHPDQLKQILEALAQVKGMPSMSVELLLNREVRQIPWETTIVVITAVPTRSMLASIKHFQRAGRRIALILIGVDNTAVRIDNVLTYRVSEDVYRKNLDKLSLVPAVLS